MDSSPDKSKAKDARAEVSRQLRAYYASLSRGLEEGAAEMLDGVERIASKREPELPSHPG